MSVIRYYFRLECGSEDRMSPVYGPFPEFLQLTYGELRTGPNGDFAAQYATDGYWYVRASLGDETVGWTDIVMWGEAAP